MSESIAIASEDLTKYFDMRARTDRIISLWWIAVPIATVGASLTLFFVFLAAFQQALAATASNAPGSTVSAPALPNVTDAELFSLAIGVVFVYLAYLLVNRRNQHFERQQRVLYDAAFILRQSILLRKGQPSPDEAEYLRRIDSTINGIRYNESPKSAWLWAILLIVPIMNFVAYFYIFYFLMRDFSEHESNEDYLLWMFSRVETSMGAKQIPSRSKNIERHSFPVYFLLLLVTLGAFSIYWIYVLIRDPNTHFRTDAELEKWLVESTLSLVSTSPRQAISTS